MSDQSLQHWLWRSQDYHCEICNITVKMGSKAKHIKTKKHRKKTFEKRKLYITNIGPPSKGV